jgi:hypothetical protein
MSRVFIAVAFLLLTTTVYAWDDDDRFDGGRAHFSNGQSVRIDGDHVHGPSGELIGHVRGDHVNFLDGSRSRIGDDGRVHPMFDASSFGSSSLERSRWNATSTYDPFFSARYQAMYYASQPVLMYQPVPVYYPTSYEYGYAPPTTTYPQPFAPPPLVVAPKGPPLVPVPKPPPLVAAPKPPHLVAAPQVSQ